MPGPLFLFAPGAGAPALHPWMQRWRAALAGNRRGRDVRLSLHARRPETARSFAATDRGASTGPGECANEERHRRADIFDRQEHGRADRLPPCAWRRKWMVWFVLVIRFARWGIGTGCATKFCARCARQFCSCREHATRCVRSICSRVCVRKWKRPTFCIVVEGGDHSLGVGKRQLQADGETQEEVDRRILESIARFVHSPR